MTHHLLRDPLLELLKDTAEESGYKVLHYKCMAGIIREITLADQLRIQIYPIGGIHKLNFRNESGAQSFSEIQLYSLGSLDIEIRRGLQIAAQKKNKGF